MDENPPNEEKKTTEKAQAPEESKPLSAPPEAPIATSDSPVAQSEALSKHGESEKTYEKQQICLMERQVRAAEALNCITIIGAVVGVISIFILFVTLLITKQSVNTASKQLELSERPWAAIMGARVVKPVAFDKGGAFGVYLTFDVKNTGNSVALKVWIEAGMDGIWQQETALREAQTNLCKGVRLGDHAGIAIFPGQEIPVPSWASMNGTQTKDSVALYPGRNIITPLIIGCIDYQFGFEKVHHQSGFAYSLDKADNPDEPSGRAGFAPVGTYSPDALRLYQYPFGGAWYAD